MNKVLSVQPHTGSHSWGGKWVRRMGAWPIIWHLFHSPPLYCGEFQYVSVFCVTKICKSLAAVVKRGALKNTQQSWVPATVYRQIWGWVVWNKTARGWVPHILCFENIVRQEKQTLRNEHRLKIRFLEDWLIGWYDPTLCPLLKLSQILKKYTFHIIFPLCK